MILYRTNAWIHTVFTCTGSVWPNIRRPLLCWIAFATVCFGVSDWLQTRLGCAGHSVLGSTISFLLIFRANTAYSRFWMGRTCVSDFFDDLRNIIMFSMLYIERVPPRHAGAGPSLATDIEEEGRKLRVNIVRLTVAFAVLLKTHTRIGLDGYVFGSISGETKRFIDWDRLRLRQLLSPKEFEFVDGCLGIAAGGMPSTMTMEDMAEQLDEGSGLPGSGPDTFEVTTQPAARMHLAIVYLLREQFMMNMNDLQNTVPWGIKERFVPIFSNILNNAQLSFETISQIMTTPLPLPYACLCKTLLTIWMASYPFILDFRLGYFGGIVIPVLVVFALLGIDAIATELENPFGDDANDLDLIELIHNLESEAMEFLVLCGDDVARSHFVWRRLPDFISKSSCKPVRDHLACTRFLAAEDASSRSQASSESGKQKSSRSGSSSSKSSESL